jgi:hypothetical protein
MRQTAEDTTYSGGRLDLACVLRAYRPDGKALAFLAGLCYVRKLEQWQPRF